jgi:single-stranded DNA-binding protein
MAPLHRVYFLGTVIQDPEVWSAPNGTAVARWGLAVPTRLRQGDTWHEDVCCIEVLAFGRQVDIVKAALRLVLCQDEIVGYSLLNFTRASSVVNCQ